MKTGSEKNHTLLIPLILLMKRVIRGVFPGLISRISKISNLLIFSEHTGRTCHV